MVDKKRISNISPAGIKLLRNTNRQTDQEDDPEEVPKSVSAGPIDKVIELAFNPSRDKIREVTVIDRMQGRLLPQLDLVSLTWQYVIEVATFRQNSVVYAEVYKKPFPVPPDLIAEFIYRTAQWQKSIAGKNLERAIDIALAETETRSGDEEGDYRSGEDWKD